MGVYYHSFRNNAGNLWLLRTVEGHSISILKVIIELCNGECHFTGNWHPYRLVLPVGRSCYALLAQQLRISVTLSTLLLHKYLMFCLLQKSLFAPVLFVLYLLLNSYEHLYHPLYVKHI